MHVTSVVIFEAPSGTYFKNVIFNTSYMDADEYARIY